MPVKGDLKTYPPELVAQVRQLYGSGLGKGPVGKIIGVHASTVLRLMIRHDIPRRRVGAAPGEAHPRWMGDQASYVSFHRRVYQARGKPSHCEQCGMSDPDRRYEWANQTGNYADVTDYKRLCKPCHEAFDRSRRAES